VTNASEGEVTKPEIRNDVKGQYAPSQADVRNDGTASATPGEVTANDDATLENADKKPSPNPGLNIREQTNRR
jgi:hypothetical protein